MRHAGVILFLLLLPLFAAAPADAQKTGEWPRFMSVKWREARVRVGPGLRYPVRWVYQRPSMPVVAQRRVANWVLIKDREGDEGWIHVNALSGRRTVIVVGALRELRDAPRPAAPLVARVQGGVIGGFDRCDGAWCKAEFQGYDGWIKRSEIWGVSDQD